MTEQPAEQPAKSHEQMKAEARAVLEMALQDYIRLCRPEVGNLYIQDYVICTAAESMDPGQSNITYSNDINRYGMATYQVVGLLYQGIDHYKANA